MDWNIIWGILGTLAATLIVMFTLWKSLRTGYEDYMTSIEDGAVTDAEKIKLADDLLKAIDDAKNLWVFILKLIASFKSGKR